MPHHQKEREATVTDERRQCCALEIIVWERPGVAPHVYSVRCDPPSGGHPNPHGACDLLHSDADIFAPVPPGTLSTQMYGGPQRAVVTGTRLGRAVSARFSRHNGAEIARWNRAVPVLPDPTER